MSASDTKRSVHCEPVRTGFLETDAEHVRMVSADYPLPTWPNEAAITAGLVDGWTHIHKFGHNKATPTTYTPICAGGVYRTPQVSGATTLRVKAGGHADDTAAGDGAREITLEGLDETGAAVTETLATAGADASSATATTFLRLTRCYVSASGTYATQSAGSHTATITIEDGAGSEDWATISLDGFANSQSYIGAYSVPLGYEAYVMDLEAFTDSNKTTDLIFFQRQNILETAPPYSAMRTMLDVHLGATAQATVTPVAPLGPFPALTDLGFLGKVDSTTAEVDVNFEIWLRATT